MAALTASVGQAEAGCVAGLVLLGLRVVGHSLANLGQSSIDPASCDEGFNKAALSQAGASAVYGGRIGFPRRLTSI